MLPGPHHSAPTTNTYACQRWSDRLRCYTACDSNNRNQSTAKKRILKREIDLVRQYVRRLRRRNFWAQQWALHESSKP